MSCSHRLSIDKNQFIRDGSSLLGQQYWRAVCTECGEQLWVREVRDGEKAMWSKKEPDQIWESVDA